jgi:transposase-like protein
MSKMSDCDTEQLSRSLVEAAKRDNVNLMKDLLEKGADVHFNDDEALFAASWRGRESAVRFLIDHGASSAARNSAGAIEAAQYSHRAVVELLVAHGADRDALLILDVIEQGFDLGRLCWIAMAHASKAGVADVIRVLLKHSRKIYGPKDISKLVVMATRNGHGEAVSVLLGQPWDEKIRQILTLTDLVQAFPRNPTSRYDYNFKEKALELWLSSGKSTKEAAKELGVSPATLRTWKKQDVTLSRKIRQHHIDNWMELSMAHGEIENLRMQRDLLLKAQNELPVPMKTLRAQRDILRESLDELLELYRQ